MNLKKILAGALLAGTLTVGGASIAAAEDTPARTRPTQEQLCQRAEHVWQRLTNLDERIRGHYEKLVALRDKAAAEGNSEAVARLDTRLERVKTAHERLVARLQELHDKAQGRCALAEPDTAAL